MIIIEPIAITDAILTATNVPEAVVSTYSAGTTYAVGDRAGPAPVYGAPQTVYESLQAGAGHAQSDTAWWKVVGVVYPAYASGSSCGIGDIVSDLANHLLYQSLVAPNTGNPLTDATKWLSIGPTNAWAMFDQQNQTITSNAGSIAITLNPALIASGFYVGNVDADEVAITITDAIDGLVYAETQSLIMSTSGSSFYKWCFGRILKKTTAVSVLLPPYANATIVITLTKTGGTAKCGMCVIGPLVDVGLSLYGLGTDIKDYSTTQFNFDGTSATVQRGFAKRMTVDVVLDNDVIDSVQDILAGYRQTNVVWIGSTRYGSSILFGKFSSFKNVIEYPNNSNMALQIEGTV